MSIIELPKTKNNRIAPGSPLMLDIGKRLRALRVVHDMSQEDLARKLDITFQQVQKYENGKNQIPIPRLLQICDVFKVDWGHFLDPRPADGVDPQIFLHRHRTAIELMEAFEAISDASTRRLVISVAESLADKS